MDESNPAYDTIMDYIERNPAAVLSSLTEDGQPHGAVVYVCTASHGTVCFVTKNQTKKFENITAQPAVSLTFFNDKEGSTLQIQGNAFVAADDSLVRYVLDKIAKLHAIQADWLPPVSKIQSGQYKVIGVEIKSARLAEYQGVGINGPRFTEI